MILLCSIDVLSFDLALASAGFMLRAEARALAGDRGAYFFPGTNTHLFETNERSFNNFNRRNCVFKWRHTEITFEKIVLNACML